ncbi:protein of unknown function [Tenacibaculum jejuense]|uniref:Uncharacterized protein n=1 Tax=Tenacibaculum jejuense TaxID=584609 RepID=A0A238U9B1_9FLAO|nr:protein of unknown function [Tenacibaculum jejuense]
MKFELYLIKIIMQSYNTSLSLINTIIKTDNRISVRRFFPRP